MVHFFFTETIVKNAPKNWKNEFFQLFFLHIALDLDWKVALPWILLQWYLPSRGRIWWKKNSKMAAIMKLWTSKLPIFQFSVINVPRKSEVLNRWNFRNFFVCFPSYPCKQPPFQIWWHTDYLLWFYKHFNYGRFPWMVHRWQKYFMALMDISKKWGLKLMEFLGIFFSDSLYTHAQNHHSKFEGVWTICCGFISIWILDIFHEKWTSDHSIGFTVRQTYFSTKIFHGLDWHTKNIELVKSRSFYFGK